MKLQRSKWFLTIPVLLSLMFASGCSEQTKVDSENTQNKNVNPEKEALVYHHVYRGDAKKVWPLLLELAEEGSAKAQYSAFIGYSGSKLYGQEQNLKLARLWLEKAANSGHDEAITDIPYYHFKGKFGFEKNETIAHQLVNAAIDSGSPLAHFWKSKWYFEGLYGVDKDKTKAKDLLDKASKLGSANASRQIAIYHKKGKYGYIADSNEYNKFLHLSAEQGNLNSQTDLVDYYQIIDNEKALKYALLCAEQGSVDCKLWAGMAYGNAKKYKLADFWYREALYGNHWQAQEFIDSNIRNMELERYDKEYNSLSIKDKAIIEFNELNRLYNLAKNNCPQMMEQLNSRVTPILDLYDSAEVVEQSGGETGPYYLTILDQTLAVDVYGLAQFFGCELS